MLGTTSWLVLLRALSQLERLQAALLPGARSGLPPLPDRAAAALATSSLDAAAAVAAAAAAAPPPMAPPPQAGSSFGRLLQRMGFAGSGSSDTQAGSGGAASAAGGRSGLLAIKDAPGAGHVLWAETAGRLHACPCCLPCPSSHALCLPACAAPLFCWPSLTCVLPPGTTLPSRRGRHREARHQQRRPARRRRAVLHARPLCCQSRGAAPAGHRWAAQQLRRCAGLRAERGSVSTARGEVQPSSPQSPAGLGGSVQRAAPLAHAHAVQASALAWRCCSASSRPPTSTWAASALCGRASGRWWRSTSCRPPATQVRAAAPNQPDSVLSRGLVS